MLWNEDELSLEDESWKPDNCWSCGKALIDGEGICVLLIKRKDIEENGGREEAFMCDYCEAEQCVPKEKDEQKHKDGLDWAEKVLRNV